MWISKQTLTVFFCTSKPAQLGERISIESAPVLVFSEKEAPAWMGRNEDSLLRAAGEKRLLASATRGGSCAHPDQSRGLVPRHNMRAISGVGASSPLLLFFLGGGVVLHERLVGVWSGRLL